MLLALYVPYVILLIPLLIVIMYINSSFRLFVLSITIGLVSAIIPITERNSAKYLHFNQSHAITSIKAVVKDDSRLDNSGRFKTTLTLKEVGSYYAVTEAKGNFSLFANMNELLYKGEKIVMEGEFRGDKNYFFAKNEDIKRDGFTNNTWLKRSLVKKAFTQHSIERLGSAFGLFTAITTGDRNYLDPITQHVFLQTGLNHLLVLSGYHVGLLSAFIFLILRAQGIRRASLMAIPLLFLYLVLSGFQYSLARAVIMATIAAACYQFYVRIRSIDLLSFSFVVILILDPQSIDSLSFQLSFLAMLGIITLQTPIKKGIQAINPRIPKHSFSQALAAQLTTTPILLYRFQQIFPVALFLGLLSTFLISSYIAFCMIVIIWPFNCGLTFLKNVAELYHYFIVRLLYYISFFPIIKFD